MLSVPNVESALTSFPEYWFGFNLVSKRALTLSGGTPAYEIVFTGNSDLSPDYTSKCKYLVVLSGEKAFWIMATSNPSQFSSHLPVINEVLYSFRLG